MASSINRRVRGRPDYSCPVKLPPKNKKARGAPLLGCLRKSPDMVAEDIKHFTGPHLPNESEIEYVQRIYPKATFTPSPLDTLLDLDGVCFFYMNGSLELQFISSANYPPFRRWMQSQPDGTIVNILIPYSI